MANFYVQCDLEKQMEGYVVTDTAWIPEKFATINRNIKIKIDNEWSLNWKVVKMYGKEEEEKVEKGERDYLKQRKVSDV